MKPLTTGEVAELFHLSKSTLRHYIDKELISPDKDSTNNYYLFSETDIYRLYQICLQANTEIQIKINELVQTKSQIQTIIDNQQKYLIDETVRVTYETRYFKKISEEIIEDGKIDYSKASKLKLENFDVLSFVLYQNEQIPCISCMKHDSDYTFEEGVYISKSFEVQNDDEFNFHINQFSEELNSEVHTHTEHRILTYENIYSSLGYRDKMIYSIEVKI